MGEVDIHTTDPHTYMLPSNDNLEFTWSVHSLGEIVSGQGTNEVEIVWEASENPLAFTSVSVFGETENGCTSDLADAIGEMANIVAGGGRNILDTQGCSFSISLPLVLEAEGHKLSPIKDIPCYIIKFKSNLGNFLIEVSLKKNE